jgi:NodT family efflux transporter outer membrane factor (OMF) lipoprotein
MKRSATLAAFAFLFCSACAVGPKYQRPAAIAPPALKELAGNDQWKMAMPSDELMKGKWWETFGFAELNRLEQMINIDNQNVKAAEAQFRQARALMQANRANYYPTIGSSPAITQTDSGKNAGRLGGTSQTFSLPATVSWEPDLWGRVRLSVESATASAQVSAADLENVRLSAQATLAADYFILVANDMQEAILQNTIAAYQRNLQLTINRYNGGVASKSDVTLAQTSLAGAQAQSTDLRIARAANEHAIAVLVGKPPSEFSIPAAKIEGPPPPIPVALPSLLLERRPDIAAAERQVAVANANIGLQQTAFYPTLTLSATPGLLSTSLANLVTWGSRVWSAGPSVSQTLFDFGRRSASIQGAEASYDQTVANYRQTVLAAFQEVEDDLASLRYLAEEAVQQQAAVVAAEQALDLELARYRAGTDSYLNVITTQTIALSDEQTAVSILQRRMLAAVDLVKALGGGWDASTLPTADQMRSAAMANPENTRAVAQPANR